jgi:uncharacterized protein (TIGR02231 family)
MPIIETTIAAVTVFIDQARVTRRGRLQLTVGEQTVTLTNLPLTILNDSVRVSGRGAGVTILGVDVATEFITEPPEVNVAELQRQLEQLQDQDRELVDNDATLAARAEFLKTLGTSGGSELTRGLAFGRSGIEQISALAEYMSREQAAVAMGRREIAQQRRELQRQIDVVRGKLGMVKPGRGYERRSIHVQLDASTATELDLEVTYIVHGASWSPIYDLRVNNDQVAVTYQASVQQHSGEDWPAVQLALSTARPAVTREMPELDPWYVNIYQPPVVMAAPMKSRMRMQEVAEADMEVGAAAMPAAYMSAPAAPIPQAKIAEASVESTGGTVTYRVARPVAIPSDGSPHRTMITTFDLPAKLDYITAPKLATEAYLRAKVTNRGDYTLLPGEATVFNNDEFVGSTRLDLTAPNEEFELQLGIDDRVKVERELIGRDVSKTLIGNIRKTQVAYRIKLTSLLDHPATVTVLDQVPHSQHEEVKVKLGDFVPRATEVEDLGNVRWELQLQPKAKLDITFGFILEHPRDKQIVGFAV